MLDGKKVKRQTQQVLDLSSPTGIKEKKIKLNAKIFHVPDELQVYHAEITGARPEGLSESEVGKVAASRLEVPAALHLKEIPGGQQYFLISIRPIQDITFIRDGRTFHVVPRPGQIKLTRSIRNDQKSIQELFRAEIQDQLSRLDYILPSSVRTKWGRNPKDYAVKALAAETVIPLMGTNYHVFKALNFRVYWYMDVEVLVVLDTHYLVIESELGEGITFRELAEQSPNWVSTEDLPAEIDTQILSMRKCSAKERYKRDMEILEQLDFKGLIVDNGVRFETKDFRYLPEPIFDFGKRTQVHLREDQPLSECLLTNLKKYGPAESANLPKILRARVVRMQQISEPRHIILVKQAIEAISEVLEECYGPKLEMVGDILELPEMPEEVEDACQALRDSYKNGAFDLVIGFLKGSAHNHPFRKAIKSGLQQVP